MQVGGDRIFILRDYVTPFLLPSGLLFPLFFFPSCSVYLTRWLSLCLSVFFSFFFSVLLLIFLSTFFFVSSFFRYLGNLFSRSAERSVLLIESEERSAESRSDVTPSARAAQADANLDQGLYIYIFIYLFIYLFIWMCARHF